MKKYILLTIFILIISIILVFLRKKDIKEVYPKDNYDTITFLEELNEFNYHSENVGY